MRLFQLSLTNFRNYTRLELSLPEGPVLLHGANAQGKTSILEAVYYLATSRSPWTTSDRQLLNWRTAGDPMPYARITSEAQNARRPMTRIEITLVKEISDGVASFKKDIRVNGVRRRALDLLGEINVVMFLPQDLVLVEGTPKDRRHYLNVTLCQTDPDYAHALRNYDHALEQRNALLRRIQGRKASADELSFWDNEIVAAGSTLIAGRQRLLRDLEGLAQTVHADLTGGAEVLELHYQPSFAPTAKANGQLSFELPGLDLHRQLAPQEIEGQFRTALEELRRKEIAEGKTLVGPQRDDLRMSVNGHDLSLYGSRGQARTAVIAIKLAEMGWMQAVTGEWPILLLDELIAELDHERRNYLLDRIDGATQAILTTTEPDIFSKSFLAKAAVWRVQSGQVATESSK